MASNIKKMRELLGLSTTELAYRLGLQQSTVVRLEQSEVRGAITLASLRRAAEALGCEFRYSLVLKEKRKNLGGKRSTQFRATETGRKKSVVADSLRKAELLTAGSLSGEQRLCQAIELSDFAMRFRGSNNV